MERCRRDVESQVAIRGRDWRLKGTLIRVWEEKGE